MQTIDLDLLRSLVGFHETGSLVRAADRQNAADFWSLRIAEDGLD